MRDLSKMTNIEDLRVVCKRNVPKMFYEYVDTGSWTQPLIATTYPISTLSNSNKRYWQIWITVRLKVLYWGKK